MQYVNKCAAANYWLKCILYINQAKLACKYSRNVRLKSHEVHIIGLHKILLHELCHYSLAKLGKPFFDGDPYFENELLRVNAISSGYINVNRRKADTGTQFRIYDIMDIYDSSDNIIDTIECTHQKASYDNVYTSF